MKKDTKITAKKEDKQKKVVKMGQIEEKKSVKE